MHGMIRERVMIVLGLRNAALRTNIFSFEIIFNVKRPIGRK